MRGLHRRTFAVVGAALLAFAAACAGDPDSADPSAAEDPNGNINIAFSGGAATFDPHKAPTPAEFAYFTAVYDRLLRLSTDGTKLEPQLAEAWSFAPDGSYLELKLRTGVKFHDGTPFDAEVVKLNVERAKTVQGTRVAPQLASVDGVTVVDPATVRLQLVAGRGADLPTALAGYPGFMVSPKILGGSADFGLDPVTLDGGSGPYRVSAFKPGESVSFERVDGYWGGIPERAKTMTVTFVASTAARVNGLRAGQFDLAQITGVDVPTTQKLIDQGVMKGYTRTVRISYWLFLNAAMPPLDNQQVRQAINYAVDRESIGNGLYGGACVPNYQPYENGFWASSRKLDNKYTFDEQKAKDLVASSGVTNKTVTIEFGAQSAYEPAATAIQTALTKIGLDAKLGPVPQAEAFTRFNAGTSQAVVTGMIPGADPSVLVANYLLGGANLAIRGGGAAGQQISQLAAQGVDPRKSDAERAAIYQQIQEIASDQAWFAQICSSQHLWIRDAKVLGADDTFRGLWQGLPELGELRVTASA
ncbi:ABC transporter substrate-binding protein [Phytohabitans sp. ZYX-F-186]|uniref:ABC transporter substrate-binding protein n=1 Tax=Phytohabitans maris TaxID=3071409 RepID=A0ABU0ZYA4_9ACTN|nr:ABC transporter substrate-binding protein [Phytohabitans sp. ZYX-F-186]MDQ7911274.1 ABC transporter substrate-binding protein [Phytohabitans sp. ZYX-F-186]